MKVFLNLAFLITGEIKELLRKYLRTKNLVKTEKYISKYLLYFGKELVGNCNRASFKTRINRVERISKRKND